MTDAPPPDRRAVALADELARAREAFLAALAGLPPALREAPSLVGEWSARELIAHLGYWAGHATEAIHHAEQGRAEEFDVDPPSTDARNATVARVARETDPATVRAREEASVQALVTRLRRMDPTLLDIRLPDGDSVEAQIRADGPDHYAEHTADLEAAAGR